MRRSRRATDHGTRRRWWYLRTAGSGCSPSTASPRPVRSICERRTWRRARWPRSDSGPPQRSASTGSRAERALIWKLLTVAEKRVRKLHVPHRLGDAFEGSPLEDGMPASTEQRKAAALCGYTPVVPTSRRPCGSAEAKNRVAAPEPLRRVSAASGSSLAQHAVSSVRDATSPRRIRRPERPPRPHHRHRSLPALPFRTKPNTNPLQNPSRLHYHHQ